MNEKSKEAVAVERLAVTYVALSALRPNAYNPNRQSPHDFELLCRSIVEDGFTRPIVARRQTMEIVDGEHRWRAATALHTQGSMDFSLGVPVVLVDMTDAQARIATMKYNRIHGSEDAGLAAAVLRDIVEMGGSDWAQDSLMLDDVEMARLTKEIADEAREAEALPPPPAEALGPNGAGLAPNDAATGVDLTADARRANEQRLQQAKKEEEVGMAQKNASDTFRLVLFFANDEAEVVRQALGDQPAAKLLELCRSEVTP